MPPSKAYGVHWQYTMRIMYGRVCWLVCSYALHPTTAIFISTVHYNNMAAFCRRYLDHPGDIFAYPDAVLNPLILTDMQEAVAGSQSEVLDHVSPALEVLDVLALEMSVLDDLILQVSIYVICYVDMYKTLHDIRARVCGGGLYYPLTNTVYSKGCSFARSMQLRAAYERRITESVPLLEQVADIMLSLRQWYMLGTYVPDPECRCDIPRSRCCSHTYDDDTDPSTGKEYPSATVHMDPWHDMVIPGTWYTGFSCEHDRFYNADRLCFIQSMKTFIVDANMRSPQRGMLPGTVSVGHRRLRNETYLDAEEVMIATENRMEAFNMTLLGLRIWCNRVTMLQMELRNQLTLTSIDPHILTRRLCSGVCSYRPQGQNDVMTDVYRVIIMMKAVQDCNTRMPLPL